MLPALLLLVLPQANATRIAVPDMQLAGEIEESVGTTMTEALVTETSKLGGAEVIGASDIVALLGFEQQKQLLGCTDVACIAEIGGALGADLLLVSDLGRVGESWALNLKLIDAVNVRVLGRVNRVVEGNIDRVLARLKEATRDLLARLAAPPAEATTWPMWTLIGVGGTALATSMGLEIAAAREYRAAGESEDIGDVILGFGGYEVHAPSARGHYDSARQLSRAALGVAIGGAVVAGAGVTWLLLRDDPEAQLTIAPAVGSESGSVLLTGSW